MLSVLTVWSMLGAPCVPPAICIVLLLRLLLQVRPVSMWVQDADTTDAALQAMPLLMPLGEAGLAGGMNAGICGLSGELVVLLLA